MQHGSTAAHAGHGQHYGSRLATRLTRGVDARLRLHALLQRKPLSHVINQILDEALPSAAELRRQLRPEGQCPDGR